MAREALSALKGLCTQAGGSTERGQALRVRLRTPPALHDFIEIEVYFADSSTSVLENDQFLERIHTLAQHVLAFAKGLFL